MRGQFAASLLKKLVMASRSPASNVLEQDHRAIKLVELSVSTEDGTSRKSGGSATCKAIFWENSRRANGGLPVRSSKDLPQLRLSCLYSFLRRAYDLIWQHQKEI